MAGNAGLTAGPAWLSLEAAYVAGKGRRYTSYQLNSLEAACVAGNAALSRDARMLELEAAYVAGNMEALP